jgi:hypothetical protein
LVIPAGWRAHRSIPLRYAATIRSLAHQTSHYSIGRFGGYILRAANYVRNPDGQQSSELLPDLPSVPAAFKSAGHLSKFPKRIGP